MPLQQVVDEIADDQIRLARAFVHDATGKDPGRGIPLEIDGAAAPFRAASQLGPARETAGLPFQQDLEVPGVELRIVAIASRRLGPGVQMT